MKKAAVEKAYIHLVAAKRHFQRLAHSRTFEEHRSIWSDFLTKANSIHSILEFGARPDPRSRQWFGGKKKERTDDPLLQYLHQARNVDEHGIDFPLEFQDQVLLSVKEGDESFPFTQVREGVWKVTGVKGRRPTVTFSRPRAILVPVTDHRFGTVFHPPQEHLGQPLADDTPETCGKLWLEYLDRLIREAGAFTR